MNYKALEDIFREIGILETAMRILSWDQETNMPIGAATERGLQMSTLSSIVHKNITSENVSALVNSVNSEDLNDWQRSNFRLMKKSVALNNALPAQLVQDLSIATTNSSMAWRKAKVQNNFSLVKEELKRTLHLTREFAKIKADLLGCSPYEALMDEYEPGIRMNFVTDTLMPLEKELKTLINKESIQNQQAIKTDSEISRQKDFIDAVLRQIGFVSDNSRWDTSTHPFCSGSTSDIRITTRFMQHDFTQALYGAIHEAGHANYNAHLPSNWIYQPVGKYLGMGVHESQSLIYEYMIGTHPAFLLFLEKLIDKTLGKKIPAELLHKHLMRIQPSLIRVDADQTTYHMHIIIRCKIEMALINNELSVEQIPEAWNAEYQKLLGITPQSDSEGCLQDIHWFIGCFGYFPTYTIGAILAAQIMHYAQIDNANLLTQLKNGDLSEINRFLERKIHKFGSLFSTTEELMHHSFNEGLNAQYLIKYLSSNHKPPQGR